jgi:hypothetical protein
MNRNLRPRRPERLASRHLIACEALQGNRETFASIVLIEVFEEFGLLAGCSAVI